jgi:hypothetical protein
MDPVSWKALGALLLTVVIVVMKALSQRKDDAKANDAKFDSDLANTGELPEPGWLGTKKPE